MILKINLEKIPQSVIHDRWRACSIHPYMSTWEGSQKRKYLVGGQEKKLGGIDAFIYNLQFFLFSFFLFFPPFPFHFMFSFFCFSFLFIVFHFLFFDHFCSSFFSIFFIICFSFSFFNFHFFFFFLFCFSFFVFHFLFFIFIFHFLFFIVVFILRFSLLVFCQAQRSWLALISVYYRPTTDHIPPGIVWKWQT